MEMVAAASAAVGSAFSGLFGGTAAAAGTAAAGTAAAGTAAATGVSLGQMFTLGSTLLSGTATALSVLQSGRAGAMEAASFDARARDSLVSATNEEIDGRRARVSLTRDLIDTVARQDVAWAASGLDLGQGTAQEARARAFEEADRQLSIDADTTAIRAARWRERASGYAGIARSVRRGQAPQAAARLLEFGAGVANRFADRVNR